MGQVKVLRLFSAAFYGLLGGIAGAALSAFVPSTWTGITIGVAIAIGALLGFAGAPFILLQPLQWSGRTARLVPAQSLIAGTLGLIVGLFIASLLSVSLSNLPGLPGRLAPLAASLFLGAVGIAIAIAWERELGQTGRRFFPRLAPSDGIDVNSQLLPRQLLLDTSAIIDGRIAEINRSGFLQGTFVVPRFVLEELRHVADSTDSQRRTRGRRGLEMLNTMQQEKGASVQVLDLEVDSDGEVDDKLLVIAARLHAPIVTTDFNLNRVAALQGISVLNVNELANALRPPVLSGEDLTVYVKQEGKEPNQGLAFLDDGTMVVVEGGRRFIGYDIEVVVTRVLQTPAGRIIFTHPKDA